MSISVIDAAALCELVDGGRGIVANRVADCYNTLGDVVQA